MGMSHTSVFAGQDPYSEALPENRHVLAGQWCVGATLRSARKAGGESLEDVAEAVRIRAEYLYAIEEENYYSLPGWAHAVGYVRSYAMYLGLDSGPLVRRVRDQLALREHVFEQQSQERSRGLVRMISLGGIAVVLGTLGFGLWFTGPAQSVTEFLRPVPDRIISFIDRSLKSAVPAAPAAAVAKADALTMAARLSGVSAADVSSKAQSPNFGPMRAGVAMVGPRPDTGIVVVKPLPRHSIDRGGVSFGEVTLRARENVWFRVEDRQGAIVAERQMDRGEVQRLPNVRDLVIAAPNGGAIEYYVDGAYAGVLGGQGQSVRGLSLAKLAEHRAGG
ncbi:hypothetical protein MNBD_ALPHA09-283 [hydrothermal vent metagenome]|uniref:Cytoskeleton protein RodZ-like C-terminal domain-containing protein n=1 Tax=hydrothermal vent metagenome TaxID=652676 RepID=A0A3B0U157_9ZZZZ